MKQKEIEPGKFYVGKSGNIRFVDVCSGHYIEFINIGKTLRLSFCGDYTYAPGGRVTRRTFARWAVNEVRPIFKKVERV
jgi:hypothetical protein